MSWISMFAIYFIIWWVVLFAVLPFGVRNAHEAGEAVGEGHDEGAPVQPLLARKIIATTAVSALVFAVVWWIVSSGFFSLDDIPLIGLKPELGTGP